MTDRNEREFGLRVCDNLDRGLSFDASTLQRLHQARESALQRQAAAEPRFPFATAIANTRRLPLIVLAGLLVFGCLFVTAYWFQTRVPESADADAELVDGKVLLGELPIDAYLDRGFAAWLKQPDE